LNDDYCSRERGKKENVGAQPGRTKKEEKEREGFVHTIEH
jgi:hypothetical protein